MNDWLGRIEQNISGRKLLQRNESVLVAVSGGLDSMVLLDLLHELAKTHGWRITVAHFNHKLRGRSSDADERLVKKIATNLKLKCVSDRSDVNQMAEANHLSVEMAARKLRHEFLAQTARKLKIKTIALAHHSDDQVELFFLRLLRGAGSEGLSGMKWKSNSPVDPSFQLVRPLLDQPKEFLQEYARINKIMFREDASNASLDFQRNRIRHEVVPLLRTIQPGLNETILRTMEIVAEDSDFVLTTALKWLNTKTRLPLNQLHIAVQRMCIRLQIRALGFAENFTWVEQLRTQSNRIVVVDSEHSIYRDEQGAVLQKREKAICFNSTEIKIQLSEQGEIQFGQRNMGWSVQNKTGGTIPRKRDCEFFDAQKIGATIILRHWKTGDRFQPIGGKSSKKLQDLFMDLKIPREERHQRIVATTEPGEIFWVEGLRIGERFKLDNQSQQRLKWMWRRL